MEARDLIAKECSGLCSGFPIKPNAQDEFLLFCLTKGFEIQGLGWQEQPKLRRFYLWASMCIGNVLVHPLALKNKPFSFQRTANFVVTLIFFFSWFIGMHSILHKLYNFYFLTIPLRTLVFRFLGRGKRESWGKSSLKREDNLVPHLEQCLSMKSNSVRLPDSQHVASWVSNIRGTVNPK